jgi:hypothetical protein
LEFDAVGENPGELRDWRGCSVAEILGRVGI